MDNALREPANVLLFGGTSDIGLAIIRELLTPSTRVVVLACRDLAAGETQAASLRHESLVVEVVHFDGSDPLSAATVVADMVSRHGDVDLAILAHARLGDPQITTSDPAEASALLTVNTTSVVAAMVAAGGRMRTQGHGDLMVISSVAGERVRASNPTYGASKAAIDAFSQGYGDRVAADGVHVIVVRPGYVHTSMTAGIPPSPFSTTPETVAQAAVRGLRARRRTVWVPSVLRVVLSVLRHVPGPVWRRLPLG